MNGFFQCFQSLFQRQVLRFEFQFEGWMNGLCVSLANLPHCHAAELRREKPIENW